MWGKPKVKPEAIRIVFFLREQRAWPSAPDPNDRIETVWKSVCFRHAVKLAMMRDKPDLHVRAVDTRQPAQDCDLCWQEAIGPVLPSHPESGTN